MSATHHTITLAPRPLPQLLPRGDFFRGTLQYEVGNSPAERHELRPVYGLRIRTTARAGA